jgi:integrase
MQCSHRISSTPERRQLSINELRQILSIAKEDSHLRDLYDIASVISFTGIRFRELSNLRWADVDFPNRRAVVFCPKSMREHLVPFGPKTLQILKTRRSWVPASEFVFGDTPSALLNRVAHQLRSVGRKVGAGSVSVSVLRHTFFSRLMETGADTTALISIGGFRPSYLSVRSLLSSVQQCTWAARFQAQVEEQL